MIEYSFLRLQNVTQRYSFLKNTYLIILFST